MVKTSLGFLFAMAVTAWAQSAAAQCVCNPADRTITVNSTADLPESNGSSLCAGICQADGQPSGTCTLRAATNLANACFSPTTTTTIKIPPGIYKLAAISGADTDQNGDLNIKSNVTITPDLTNGKGPVIVDAQNNGFRVFNIDGTALSPNGSRLVSFEGLVIRNGQANYSTAPIGAGGGVYAHTATLSLVRSSVIYNTGFSGGGIYVEGQSGAGSGSATLYDSTVADNSVIQDNQVGSGGGVYVNANYGYGSFTTYFSTIAANYARGSYTSASANYGGGIFVAAASTSGPAVQLTNSIVATNVSDDGLGNSLADDIYAYNSYYPGVAGSLNIVGKCSSPLCDPVFPDDPTNPAETLLHDAITLGTITASTSTGNDWNDYVLSLSSGNPAIDLAKGSTCADARNTPDQRGATRPVDGDGNGSAVCDLGAYEFQGNNVSLVKTVSKSQVAFGETFTYALTLQNQFEAQTSPLVVSDTLNTGLTFVSVSSNDGSPCTFTAPTVSCTVAPMASGATVVITVTVTANAVGPIANTATVRTGDNNPGDDTSTVTTTVVGQANTKLVKTASASAAVVGDTLMYTLTASNAGPSAATNLVVSDTLPAEVAYQSATPSQGICTSADGVTITCHLGTLALGATATVTIQVVAKSAGTVTNTAQLQQTENDPTNDNQPTAVVSVSKSTPKGSAQPLAAASFQGGGTTCSGTGHGSGSEAAAIATMAVVGLLARRRRKFALTPTLSR